MESSDKTFQETAYGGGADDLASEERERLMLDLFLEGCAHVIGDLYTDLSYQNAVCEQCRNSSPGQTAHYCFLKSKEELARERMECAIFSLQRKPWQVFRRMSQTIGWKQQKYNSLTAAEVLDFFEKKFNRLHPLERVCSERTWQNRILYKAMRNLGLYQNMTTSFYRRFIPQGEDADEDERRHEEVRHQQHQSLALGTPPMNFSQELTQDVPY